MTSLEFLRKYPEIREFVAFRACLDEGRMEGIRRSILRLGRKKFGSPTAEQEAALKVIMDEPQLESLSEKLLDVATWQELLQSS